MKRFFLILVAVTFVATTFASESGPALIPEPQKYEISRTEYIPFDAVTLVCPDAAAATWAKKHLKQWYNKLAPQVVCAQGNTASMGAEEYRLNIDKSAQKCLLLLYRLYTERKKYHVVLSSPCRNACLERLRPVQQNRVKTVR